MAYLELRNITKTFLGVAALSNVSMAVEKGEVHAIVGANGAGKSTIIKILGGLYDADGGEIWMNGRKCPIHSVAAARKAGVAVLYQELNLLPELTVAENMYLHKLPRKGGLIVDKAVMNRKAQQLLDAMEVDFKAGDLIDKLSISEQQMVAIAKAISLEGDIIVMDEPTAALNDKEVKTLYRLIKKLKEQDKTIIYISHRLKEIFDLSDRLTVLRDGCHMGTFASGGITRQQLMEKMVGREVPEYYPAADHKPGKVMLEVKHLCRQGCYQNISFTLRQGELLGITGLAGCFGKELVKTIYGLIPADNGEILIGGRPIHPKSPREAIRCGIGMVMEDRKKAGIFGLMSVRENTTITILDCLKKRGLIVPEMEQEVLEGYRKRMNIKYRSPLQRINSLSGGNQQKILLARALASGCDVLMMLEPTRGIDVGAKGEIYVLLESLAKEGMAILMVSSDLTEIIANCHRVLTVFQGEITGNIEKEKMEEAFILQCATGIKTSLGGEG